MALSRARPMRVLAVLPAVLVAALGVALHSCLAGPELYEHPNLLWNSGGLQVAYDRNVRMELNSTVFDHEDKVFLLSWSNVTDPADDDYVALYVPADANPWFTVPVQHVRIAQLQPDYLESGSGSATFKLINLRQSFGFALVRGAPFRPALVARAPPIANAIAARPSQGHLALHQDGGSVVVQWVSFAWQPQEVRYSTQPAGSGGGGGGSGGVVAAYEGRAASHTQRYLKGHMCGYPANSSGWLDPGVQHRAVIPREAMQAGGRVRYAFGSDAAGWSEEFSFVAPPAPGQPVTFLGFNDVAQAEAILFYNHCPPYCPPGPRFAEGWGRNSTKLVPHLEREAGAHAALLLGDLSYALGFAADWDSFGHQFEPAFTRWPLMVAPGNHERDWPHTNDAFGDIAYDSGGECGVPLMHRYYTPASQWLDPFRSFYSFDLGAVHFVVLDSESASDPGSPQGRFVAKDLAEVDRRRTPWLVVGMHRMMWAPVTWRSPLVGDLENMERLQRDYEELFLAHGVDVVIQGHMHAYARTCMLYRGQCVRAVNPQPAAAAEAAAAAAAASQAAGQQQQQQQQKEVRAAGEGAARPLAWLHAAAGGLLQRMAATMRQRPAAAAGRGCRGSSGSGSNPAAAVAGTPAAAAQQAGPGGGPLVIPARRSLRSWLAGAWGSGGAAPPAAAPPAGPSQAGQAGEAGPGAAPGRAPVYVLAGHAGASFSWGFPQESPAWVEYGAQGRNGYLRFTADAGALVMEAVSTDDGSVMDSMRLER